MIKSQDQFNYVMRHCPSWGRPSVVMGKTCTLKREICILILEADQRMASPIFSILYVAEAKRIDNTTCRLPEAVNSVCFLLLQPQDSDDLLCI